MNSGGATSAIGRFCAAGPSRCAWAGPAAAVLRRVYLTGTAFTSTAFPSIVVLVSSTANAQSQTVRSYPNVDQQTVEELQDDPLSRLPPHEAAARQRKLATQFPTEQSSRPIA